MIELVIAFGAGLISFLSPCVLPLIPGYISFISGASLNELLANKKINIIPLILFTLGFSFVFIMFGAAASYLGQVLTKFTNIKNNCWINYCYIFSSINWNSKHWFFKL
jgi:cytochrome c-type biogenesis protein